MTSSQVHWNSAAFHPLAKSKPLQKMLSLNFHRWKEFRSLLAFTGNYV